MNIYTNNYIKYKNKYQELKNIIGGNWDCTKCTFLNTQNIHVCEICNSPKINTTVAIPLILDNKRITNELKELKNKYNVDYQIISTDSDNTKIDIFYKGRTYTVILNKKYPFVEPKFILNDSIIPSTNFTLQWTSVRKIIDLLENYHSLNNQQVTPIEKILKVSSGRNATPHIEKLIKDIETGNFETIFQKVEFTENSSVLDIRLIDVLLHTIQDERTHEDHQIYVIYILSKIPDEIVRRIFNDSTVKYPFQNRQYYLQGKPGSTMSTILVSKFLVFYLYIIKRFPDIQLNIFDDLSIIFNHMLSRHINLDNCEFIHDPHIYIDILTHIIKQNTGVAYTDEWFGQIIINLQDKYTELLTKTWFVTADIPSKIDYISRGFRSNTELTNILCNYRSWEYQSDKDLSELITDTGINIRLIECIRRIFNQARSK